MKLIKFEKEGCAPCEMVQSFLDDKGVEVERVDAFKDPKLAGKYELNSVPTVILVEDNGDEVERVAGFNPPKLEELINQVQEG